MINKSKIFLTILGNLACPNVNENSLIEAYEYVIIILIEGSLHIIKTNREEVRACFTGNPFIFKDINVQIFCISGIYQNLTFTIFSVTSIKAN